MKRILTLAALLWTVLAAGQIKSTDGETADKVRYVYTEASDLTLAGKIFPDTPFPTTASTPSGSRAGPNGRTSRSAPVPG